MNNTQFLPINDNTFNKSANLLNKFLYYGVHPYDYLAESQLSTILQAMIGHEFDIQILKQITEQCQMNEKGEVKLQQFVTIMIEAEQALINKIQTTQNVVREQEMLKEQYQQNIQAHSSIPKNTFGLDQNASVTVNVISGTHLYQRQQTANEVPYVQITCGKNKISTTSNINIQQSPQQQEHLWNETLTLPIEMGTEDLYIDVLSYSTIQNQNFLIGKVMIPLKNFESQSKIDEQYSLYDQMNRQLPAQIRLQIQYIHNEEQLHYDIYNRSQLYVEQLNDDIIDYQEDINTIREPLYAPLNQQSKPLQVQNQLRQSKIKSDLKQFDHVPSVMWLAYVVTGIYVLVCLIENYSRYGLVDLTVALFVLKNFWTNYFDKKYIKFNIISLIFAIVYDILCLYVFNQGLFGEHRSDLVITEAQNGSLYDFSVVMMWISLFIKCIVTFCIYQIKPIVVDINHRGFYSFGLENFTHTGIHKNPFIWEHLDQAKEIVKQHSQKQKQQQQHHL